jgi:RNA polymerase sigma-B factor
LEGPEGGKNDFVAVRSNQWSESPGDLVTGSNAVSVVVPARRYTDVVRLVVAGFVSRMLGFEAVDDIQLALEAIVRSVAPDGTHVRVSLARDGEWLTLAVGSFQLDELERRLRAVVSDGSRSSRFWNDSSTPSRSSTVLRRRSSCASAVQDQLRECASTTESERRALLRAYREDGDTTARDRLIEDFLPLARSLARRYSGRGELTDDLEQVAAVGVIKAIDRFDLSREVDVVSYVFPTVVGELKRHFRDRAWSVTVPRRLKELHYRLTKLLEDLTATLGRSPTIAELATEAGIGEEEVVEALEVGRAYSSRSLTSSHDPDDGADLELVEMLDDEEPGYEAAENRQVLAAGLRTLDERERRIVHLRFVEGSPSRRSLRRSASPQMHVSRLIRRMLEKLSAEVEGP